MKYRVGRPLKFETPDDLLDAINAYLEETEEEELTITGLALAIGSSRKVLIDYEKRDDYRDIVRTAKCMIEHSYELSLRRHSKTGDIFALKNFGWRDKQEAQDEDYIQPVKVEFTMVDGRLGNDPDNSPDSD